jgi:hypothetical protein
MSANGNGRREPRTVNTGLYVKGSNGLRLRDQRVRKLVQRMRSAMLWLEDSDLPVCRAWAELEVLSSRVYAELRDHGTINSAGDARRLLDDYRKLRATQIVLSRELGMTPAARIAIKATGSRAAVALAAAMVKVNRGGGEEAADVETIGETV